MIGKVILTLVKTVKEILFKTIALGGGNGEQIKLMTGQEDPLREEMATRSSILAWRIPWTEEPGGPQSTGSQRVAHDWATKQQSH